MENIDDCEYDIGMVQKLKRYDLSCEKVDWKQSHKRKLIQMDLRCSIHPPNGFGCLLILSALCLVSCSNQPPDEAKIKSSDGVVAGEESEGMVFVQGGDFLMGNSIDPGNGGNYIEESPPHRVEVGSFWIDKHEVTNAQFLEFVEATDYVTFAEKPLSKEIFPKAPSEQLLPGATVFSPPPDEIDPRQTQDAWQWWAYKHGANWKHPEGKGSSIEDRMDHPVVCVNLDDAKAYAEWAGKRLPTEAEWEYAARGGLEEAMFTWGNEHKPDGKWWVNCFQGVFPHDNTTEDGFAMTAPVGSFPDNGYGLFDMAGNVWELCSDHYSPTYFKELGDGLIKNPLGPEQPISMIELDFYSRHGFCPEPDADSHPITFLNVVKGGSFLCAYEYCLRYRPAARHYAELLSPTNHTGFRCVKDAN